MEAVLRPQPPIWYWIGTTLFVLFTLSGVTVLAVAASQGIVAASWAYWATAIAAVAILSDVVASSGLVTRKAWAVPALAIALAFTVVYVVYGYLAMPDFSLVAILLFGAPRALALWLAVVSKARKWITARAAGH
jgi:hypothetical protein